MSRHLLSLLQLNFFWSVGVSLTPDPTDRSDFGLRTPQNILSVRHLILGKSYLHKRNRVHCLNFTQLSTIRLETILAPKNGLSQWEHNIELFSNPYLNYFDLTFPSYHISFIFFVFFCYPFCPETLNKNAPSSIIIIIVIFNTLILSL